MAVFKDAAHLFCILAVRLMSYEDAIQMVPVVYATPVDAETVHRIHALLSFEETPLYTMDDEERGLHEVDEYRRFYRVDENGEPLICMDQIANAILQMWADKL